MPEITVHLSRLSDTLAAAGRAERTIKHYVSTLRRFATFLAPRDLEAATCDDIVAYQLTLGARRLSGSSINIAASALRFFYRDVLGHKEWAYDSIPSRHHRRSRPEVLTPAEVEAIIAKAPSERYRVAFLLAYACGLRIAEVRRLEARHIDAERRVIRIERGKGGHDRTVMLPDAVLDALRGCWRHYRPQKYILEGNTPGHPLSETAIQAAFRRAARAAGITKKVTYHSLRHAFATHLVERGTSVRVVQRLMGHRNLNTTALYLHLATTWLEDVRSPIEAIGLH